MTDRRDFLSAAASAVAMGSCSGVRLSAAAEPALATSAASESPVRFALNTSTIRGQNLDLEQQIDVAAEAGYDGIEPWIRDIEKHVQSGGKLADIRKRLDDRGLSVVSAIGFAAWIVDDPRRRAEGLEQARRDMRWVAEIGGGHLAAPPIGAHRPDGDHPDLATIAARYRRLCEVGGQEGVKPELELWGFSPTLSRLGEMAYVATEAHHPMACVLPDFYHIYKGGNDFQGLAMIEASKMDCFHINDYPGQPPREQIGDKDRVFPGDGVCPLEQIIAGMLRRGFVGVFSLELFNPEYWQRPPLEVAREGLEKSRRVFAAAANRAA